MWYYIFIGLRIGLWTFAIAGAPAVGIAIGWGWGLWCLVMWCFIVRYIDRHYLLAAIETQGFLRVR